jgi:hypothetical protein
MVIIFLIALLVTVCGCGGTFFTPGDNNENIEIPPMLGYSVKVMQASKDLYNTVLTGSVDLYNKGVIDDSDVTKIISITSKYMAAHNTAQKAVSAWYNAHVNSNEGGIDQRAVITEVLKLLYLAPEIINDVNTIAGTSFDLPDVLDVTFLAEALDK